MRSWLAPSPTFSCGEITIFEAVAANAEYASGVLRSYPRHTIKRFGNHVIDVV
jgi:hypothetical protein